MPKSNVPKAGHGPKMGQKEFDCACVSVVFTCIPLVFFSPYIKPVGRGSIGLLQARILSRNFNEMRHISMSHNQKGGGVF